MFDIWQECTPKGYYSKPFLSFLVIAVDIFEKSNFTGAKVPRFDVIKEDYPRDLESSVLFPDTLLQASDRKGKVLP